MTSFDPSVLGIFVFGLFAGICPCNSVLCLGLIGYLTSGKTDLTLAGILKLTVAFSFGAITVGRGAPMLLVVLTYIALYQTAVEGFFTILVYAVGLSLPLIAISSLGGALGKKVKERARVSGEVFDRVVGVAIIAIGVYFLYLAFL